MIKKIGSLIVFAAITSSAYAINNPIPELCPSVEAIQVAFAAQGIGYALNAKNDKTSWIVGLHKQNYDTPTQWDFSQWLKAADVISAYDKMAMVVASLRFVQGPIKQSPSGNSLPIVTYLCEYSNVDNSITLLSSGNTPWVNEFSVADNNPELLDKYNQ